MSDSSVPSLNLMTCDMFAPHVGDAFSVVLNGGAGVTLTLSSAEPIPLRASDPRALGKSGSVRHDPFVLLFTAAESVIERQGVYRFNHDVMGEFMLGVVPVGPGEAGWLYESVFN